MEIVDLRQNPHLIPRLAEWHQAEWSKFNPGESLEQRISRMGACLGPGLLPTTWVALEQGEPVASAALVACDLDALPDLTPWLASLYVRADRRGQGIGSTLVRHLMTQAGAAAYRRCYLFSEMEHLGFYEQLGWKALERRRHCGQDIVVMVSELAPPG